MRRTRNRAALIALTAVTTASLVACGASETVTDEVVATTDGGTTYPLTIDNCGESVTVDAPPQRVVSLDQNSTEILLSLGLEDRLIGSASWTDPVRENLADANETVPRLADNAPTYEVVLGSEPGLRHGIVRSALQAGWCRRACPVRRDRNR